MIACVYFIEIVSLSLHRARPRVDECHWSLGGYFIDYTKMMSFSLIIDGFYCLVVIRVRGNRRVNAR